MGALGVRLLLLQLLGLLVSRPCAGTGVRVGRFLNQGLRYVVVTRGTYYKTFRIIFDFLNSFLTEGYIVKVFILFLLLKNFKPSIT